MLLGSRSDPERENGVGLLLLYFVENSVYCLDASMLQAIRSSDLDFFFVARIVVTPEPKAAFDMGHIFPGLFEKTN